jgi:hypothetical protein
MAITYAELDDPVNSVVTLLTGNWTAGHTDSTTPTIDESWDLGKKNLKHGDIVRVYEVAGNHDFGSYGHGLDKGTWRVSIDISTSVSRSRLRKLYSEVVSIIRGSRANNHSGSSIDDYPDIKLLSRVDQSDKLRRWYRYVLDCEITSYEVIQ